MFDSLRPCVVEPLENRRLLAATVYGTVFLDRNATGTRELSETAIAAYTTVYLDANANGQLDTGETSTQTNGSGNYVFANAPTGRYAVNVVAPGGYTLTTPDAPVTVTDTDQRVKADLGITAVPAAGTISGIVYLDNDNSGNFTPYDDLGTAYGTGPYGSVFVDLNNNAVCDANEPRAVINNYDEFTFTGLAAGTYSVRGTNGVYYGLSSPKTGAITVTLGTSSGVSGLQFGFAKNTGSTAGVFLYVDNNQNGVLDANEANLNTGVAVYADINNDGVRQDTEPVAQDIDGFTNFFNLPTGTYALRGLGGSGYTPVLAGVTLYFSPNYSQGPLLGFVPANAANVSGNVFSDINNNGVKDSAEPGVYNGFHPPQVYLDLNNNGALDSGEPSATTDTSGDYTINATAGTYTLRVVPGSVNDRQSYPTAGNGHLVTLTNGTTLAGQDFGLVPLGTVSGTVYNDTNGDGQMGFGEVGIGGVVVYADINGNGRLDASETSATSSSNGSYAISSVPLGTYPLQMILPSGFRATTASANTAVLTAAKRYSINNLLVSNTVETYTASVTGTAFNDTNGDYELDGVEGGLAGITLWIDANQNGKIDAGEQQTTSDADGHYVFRGLAGGSFDIDANFGANQTPVRVDYFVAVGIGEAKTGINFEGHDARPGILSGTVFNDANKNGIQDSGEAGIAGLYVFQDLDQDGTLDSNETVFKTDANGNWSAQLSADLATYRMAISNTTGRALTTAAFYDSVPHANRTTSGLNFGIVPASVPVDPKTAAVSGIAYNDTNANGLRDAAETVASGKTVFLDTNNNGKLDTGEKSVVTTSTGAWSFTALAAGVYHVRRVFPTGYAQSNALIDVTLTAGQVVAGLTIGSKSGTTPPVNTASLSGFTFNDVNKNGLYDGTDTLAAGKTIFIDLDNDGVLDANETSVVTDSRGAFTFKNLTAGTYHVRRVFPSGYAESTPARMVTLTSGQATSGVSIGSKAK